MLLSEILPLNPTHDELALAQRIIGEHGYRFFDLLEARRASGDPRYQVSDDELLVAAPREEYARYRADLEAELKLAFAERQLSPGDLPRAVPLTSR